MWNEGTKSLTISALGRSLTVSVGSNQSLQTVRCGGCGAGITPGVDNYCTTCGTQAPPLGPSCKGCMRMLDPSERFCSVCGSQNGEVGPRCTKCHFVSDPGSAFCIRNNPPSVLWTCLSPVHVQRLMQPFSSRLWRITACSSCSSCSCSSCPHFACQRRSPAEHPIKRNGTSCFSNKGSCTSAKSSCTEHEHSRRDSFVSSPELSSSDRESIWTADNDVTANATATTNDVPPNASWCRRLHAARSHVSVHGHAADARAAARNERATSRLRASVCPPTAPTSCTAAAASASDSCAPV